MTIDFPRSIQPLKALWKQAFGDTDAFIDNFFQTGFAPQRCRCIYENDKPVSVLYWFDCLWQNRPVAYLYAIATDKQFRGQGYFRELLENTHAYLAGLGYAGAVLVPAEDSLFGMYEKLGYQGFCCLEPVTISAGKISVPVRTVAPVTFLQERNARLPENALQHQMPALDFVHTYAQFYMAENCIFCAAKENSTIYFQEFFGDSAALPGIIRALGAEKCVIRLPGSRPFAMYYDLSENGMPDYFNIPLD